MEIWNGTFDLSLPSPESLTPAVLSSQAHIGLKVYCCLDVAQVLRLTGSPFVVTLTRVFMSES